MNINIMITELLIAVILSTPQPKTFEQKLKERAKKNRIEFSRLYKKEIKKLTRYEPHKSLRT